jgi:hypothetical protein
LLVIFLEHYMFNNFFRKLCHLWDNVEKYGRARQVTDDNIIRRVRCAYGIAKVTNTHSKYIIHGNNGYSNAHQSCVTRTYSACRVIWLRLWKIVVNFWSAARNGYVKRKNSYWVPCIVDGHDCLYNLQYFHYVVIRMFRLQDLLSGFMWIWFKCMNDVRQAMYVWCNTDAYWRNHCCRGKSNIY